MEYVIPFLKALAGGLVEIMEALQFTIGGITFNWFQLFIWLLIASVLIWFLKKMLE